MNCPMIVYQLCAVKEYVLILDIVIDNEEATGLIEKNTSKGVVNVIEWKKAI